MVSGVVVCFAVVLQLVTGLTIPLKRSDLFKRQTQVEADGQLNCMDMRSTAGDYYYASKAGPGPVCGLYLITDTDKLVEIEFTEFDIDCEDGGLLALVDAWELQGEFFPSIEDDFDRRYKTFCGQSKPNKLYVASQNVALIQFRIPRAGQGFRVKVRFTRSYQPCNAIAMYQEGVVTIKNYGQRKNCTVSIIYPENIRLVAVDVGVTLEGAVEETESGLTVNCQSKAGGDYVEFLYGRGLSMDSMGRMMAFCGLKSKPDRRSVTLGCRNSAVRLVSSGMYYNSITFAFALPSPVELSSFDSDMC